MAVCWEVTAQAADTPGSSLLPRLGPWGWTCQDSISPENSSGQGHLASSYGKELDSQHWLLCNPILPLPKPSL